MQVYLIVNPKSGKGLHVFKQFQDKLTIPYTSYFTEYPRHATELTKQIKEFDPDALVIVVGGDGTINEVIHGAVNSDLTVGVISSGSGNDFARHFYSFKTAAEIERFVQEKTTDRSDVGQLKIDQELKYFINNSGLGFDALICERVSRSKLKRLLNKLNLGKLIYVYYVLLELSRFKPFQLKIDTKDGSQVFEDVWFVAASNQPYFGGGMKISPHSNSEDGKLEYTIIHRLKKLRFLMIFWKVFKGNHLTYTEHVEQFNGKSLQVETKKALFGHIDGEFFAIPSEQRLYFSVSEFQLKRVTDNHSIQENHVEQIKVI
ncbi:diacylglycerol kinase family protein [Amphibacillus indicireducens]|uniref:YegS/Rv2252/BmrU family lipid kinase n=1 Tax=Amphibacillus indicireducens TaxID=1076330 RepID=A0ABP7W4C3_9BACI